MRLHPSVRLAILAAAVSLSACDLGTTDGDGSDAKVSFTVPLRFAGATVAAQRAESGGEIDQIDAVIVVKSTGEAVLRKTLREGDPEVNGVDGDGDADPTVTLRFRIPEGGETETFTLTLEAFAGGTKMFTIGPVDFQLGADGRSATVNGQAVYVGPGRDVTGVLLSPRSISISINQTATFACVGTPGNVTVFPYEVEAANSTIATVQSTTSIRGVTVGTTQLTCRLGFGSHAEDHIPVTVTNGPTITVVSGGNQTGLVNTPLANPIVVQVRNGDGSPAGGISVTFAPNLGHGSPNPATIATNASGQATTLWTLGNTPGTQILKASATVAGLPISIEIPAIAGGSGQTGSINGNIQSSQGAAIAGATLELRSGSNNTTGSVVASTTSGAAGGFTFSGLPGGQYTIRGTASGFSDGSTNVTVTVGAGVSATVTLTVLGQGAVGGTVTNAQTGLALSGASVEIRNGTGVTTGPALGLPVISAANGSFGFQNLPAGPYTLVAKATGFSDAATNVTVVAGQTASAQLSLSSTLAAGQVRITLTWTNTQLDLDSHTSVPQGSGSTIVFYGSPYVGPNCSLSTNPFACLEHDALQGDPPTESTRLGQVITPGTYTFMVHNYTADSENRAAGDNSLATSGARVDVYLGGSSTAASSFNVPAGAGNLWTVFNLSSNGSTITITPVNALSVVNFVSGPPGVAGGIGAKVAK